MTVKELKELLNKANDELEIFVASDDEGNNFRRVPDGWATVEKLNEDLDLVPKEDYAEYEELIDVFLVG